MTTGYTCEVQKGEITEFKDFAMLCARAFGALIEMKEDPLSKEIPYELTNSSISHHEKKLKEVESKLTDLKSKSIDELDVEVNKFYNEQWQSYKDSLDKKRNYRDNYTAMLSKVKSWTPPTEDHEGLKKFMIEQLESSIDFDCSTKHLNPPIRMSANTYYENLEEHLIWDRNYHKKSAQEYREKLKSSNDWLKNLRKSVEDHNNG